MRETILERIERTTGVMRPPELKALAEAYEMEAMLRDAGLLGG
ncbi:MULTISPECIES: hypothetical protein [Burkholderiaceae]|uniref:Uncharacterized protein n=1 Tax=Caballeronia sordidicola TaxID=196367 RepID=A0A242MCL2_CABSO|nr:MULTISPECIES: hypothetical protein [Burkholderiaceae]OTP68691.1 hypothetical protein PAMC26577_32560 [Caballeronia sordidicola]